MQHRGLKLELNKKIKHQHEGTLNEHKSVTLHNLYKWLVFWSLHPHNCYHKNMNIKIHSCFECRMNFYIHIAKSCKTTFHLVKIYNVYDEQRDTHVTHVDHMEMSYVEMAIDPF